MKNQKNKFKNRFIGDFIVITLIGASIIIGTINNYIDHKLSIILFGLLLVLVLIRSIIPKKWRNVSNAKGFKSNTFIMIFGPYIILILIALLGILIAVFSLLFNKI